MKTFADFGIDIGRGTGTEIACQCPQCSSSRKKKNTKPLSANTEKGVWHCNHCGWSGTLLQGEQQRAALLKPSYSKPRYVPAAVPDNRLYDWFAARGIPRDVVDLNGITLAPAYMPQVEEFVDCIQFPYYKNGEVVNVKYRSLTDKQFRQHAGAEKVLFGMQTCKPDGTLVIVEGEVDCLSLQHIGVPSVVSVPDGAPAPGTKNYTSKFEYLENCKDFLDSFEKIVLAVDGDAPGTCLATELVRRLGPERCLTIQWPDECKDANDVLAKHGLAGLAAVIQAAKPVPIDGVLEVADLAEDVVDLYRNDQRPGISTGWSVLDPYYRVRAGEMTIVTGIPSHGKSEWMDALMVNMAEDHGWKFGVFSPENFPVSNHIAKLVEKHCRKPFRHGMHRLSQQELVVALEWAHRHFYFAVHGDDSLSLDGILEKAKGMVSRYGISGFLIDPWNEIDHTMGTDREDLYISQSLTKIRRFGRRYGVHMFVVAHPAKMQRDRQTGEYPVPTLYDISGGAAWRNKADNGVVIWRDVLDEERKTTVYVQKIKNRQNGSLGNATLYWTPAGGRYCENLQANSSQQAGHKRKGSIADLLSTSTGGGLGADLADRQGSPELQGILQAS